MMMTYLFFKIHVEHGQAEAGQEEARDVQRGDEGLNDEEIQESVQT